VGEIVFAGICVGRGYINDPERTRAAFLPDPRHRGERMYRSGDFGRAIPGGKLEFLGRRDSQVKISGFRIEIGEIENRLLRIAGVRDAAVVVNAHATAFYTGAKRDVEAIREQLGQSLPAYMVPAVIQWRETLPLTENGKIDRKALAALAREVEVGDKTAESPRTATELWLAGAWADVLGIAPTQIGGRDNFFDLGGTSLTALKLLIALDRALSFKDFTAHPTLAEQAALLDERGVQPGKAKAPSGSCAT